MGTRVWQPLPLNQRVVVGSQSKKINRLSDDLQAKYNKVVEGKALVFCPGTKEFAEVLSVAFCTEGVCEAWRKKLIPGDPSWCARLPPFATIDELTWPETVDGRTKDWVQLPSPITNRQFQFYYDPALDNGQIEVWTQAAADAKEPVTYCELPKSAEEATKSDFTLQRPQLEAVSAVMGGYDYPKCGQWAANLRPAEQEPVPALTDLEQNIGRIAQQDMLQIAQQAAASRRPRLASRLGWRDITAGLKDVTAVPLEHISRAGQLDPREQQRLQSIQLQLQALRNLTAKRANPEDSAKRANPDD